MKRSLVKSCPVAQTAEILGMRWVPLILCELCCRPRAFGELTTAIPLISRTTLTQKLRNLVDAGVIAMEQHPTRKGHVYALTSSGRALCPIIIAMGEWATQWTAATHFADVRGIEPKTLMSAMRFAIDQDDVLPKRLLIRFEFNGMAMTMSAQRYWWLLIKEGDVEVFSREPSVDADLSIETDIATFSRVWMGYEGFAPAVLEGKIKLTGEVCAQVAMKQLLKLSDTPEEGIFRAIR